jgi:pimeloyl-ACP methyl ester carboxylesterase
MRVLLKNLLRGGLGIFAIATLTGVAYEQLSRTEAASSTGTPAGALECRGQGSPVVLIFATGYVPTAQPWPTVQPAIEQFTTVCNRTGVASDAHQPSTGERMVNELHEVLHTAKVSPPYVLVGWSAGGLVTRWFDHRYPGEAAGFVFVDSSHPDTQDRPPPPIAVPPWLVPVLRETGVLRVLASDGLPDWLSRRLLNRSGQREQVTAYLVFSAILRESRRAPAWQLALGSRPTVILTSEGMPRSWMSFQEDLALLSSNSVQAVVKGASHEIHLDKPEAVVAAIRDVVAAVRSGESLAEAPIP